MKRIILAVTGIVACLLVAGGCNGKKRQAPLEAEATLFDKPLDEIKQYMNGEWELVSGQNARETNEFENTFIAFDNDRYVWTEDGKAEPGKLNWRKAETGAGYEAWLMDVFYAEYPAYPLVIKGDTLYIQDCTATAYKYTLVRK
ncbi:MAG: hypothetical protein LBL58_18045 [Tannerellaceae bacterium]|jgi:hypothetical protein|nr:hypothetical protein [Tannerellaceae bacterium]